MAIDRHERLLNIKEKDVDIVTAMQICGESNLLIGVLHFGRFLFFPAAKHEPDIPLLFLH